MVQACDPVLPRGYRAHRNVRDFSFYIHFICFFYFRSWNVAKILSLSKEPILTFYPSILLFEFMLEKFVALVLWIPREIFRVYIQFSQIGVD